MTAKTIDQIVASLSAEIETLGLLVASVERSSLSQSAYIKVRRPDGSTFDMPKAKRREYFARFPKANGGVAGFWDTFTIRVSDHNAVSCRSAPNADVRPGRPMTAIEQLKFIVEAAE